MTEELWPLEEDIEMEALDEADGIDDLCYLGHSNCYDDHTAERLSDEADYEEDLARG